MKIIVEGETLELDLKGRTLKLSDVIEEVEGFLLTIGKIPIALNIDGEELTQEDLDQRSDNQMRGDEVLNFGTMGLSEFVAENLEGALEANKLLVRDINTFADELYSTEKTVDPTRVTSDIRDLYLFWLHLYRLLPKVFDGVDFGGKNFKNLFEDLQVVFKDIVTAMEEQDTVLASDLLQYEVCPVIDILTGGIPHLKENVLAHRAVYEDEKGVK